MLLLILARSRIWCVESGDGFYVKKNNLLYANIDLDLNNPQKIETTDFESIPKTKKDDKTQPLAATPGQIKTTNKIGAFSYRAA